MTIPIPTTSSTDTVADDDLVVIIDADDVSDSSANYGVKSQSVSKVVDDRVRVFNTVNGSWQYAIDMMQQNQQPAQIELSNESFGSLQTALQRGWQWARYLARRYG